MWACWKEFADIHDFNGFLIHVKKDFNMFQMIYTQICQNMMNAAKLCYEIYRLFKAFVEQD